MSVLESLLVNYKDRLDSLSISDEKKSNYLHEFSHWVQSELADANTKFAEGLDSFFVVDKSIDDRITEWQAYYSDKPADCPDSEWPIFKKHEWVDRREFGRGPLHRAVIEGDLGEVKRLIKLGEEVHAQDNGGNTAFELAVLEGHESIVNWFLDQGLDK